MYDKPLENVEIENEVSENNLSLSEHTDSYGYSDNLTSKLGGNYAKIIEFYDSRL